jgi:uncharacterized DUF497 family protein
MNFEWDDEKNILNVKIHKVSFVQAALIFSDPLRRECYDEAHSGDEDRIIAIGSANGRILFVSFTEIDPDTVRIISARKAKHTEKEFYYGNS